MAVDVRLQDNSDEIKREIERRIEAALEAAGIQMQAYAEDVITAGVPRHADSWYRVNGAHGLLGSIDHQVNMSTQTVYVGTNNEHAIYNEYGTGVYLESDDGTPGRQSPWAYKDEEGNWHRTRGMTPLHFLKKAATEHTDEILDIIREYLRG